MKLNYMKLLLVAVTFLITGLSSKVQGPIIRNATAKQVVVAPSLTEQESTLIKEVRSIFSDADKDVILAANKVEVFLDFPRREDIFAIIATESGFRKCVTDGKGSYGPMQVNIRVHDLPLSQACNPFINLTKGIEILRGYYLITGSVKKALLAYNAGLANLRKGKYDPHYFIKFKARKIQLEGLILV